MRIPSSLAAVVVAASLTACTLQGSDPDAESRANSDPRAEEQSGTGVTSGPAVTLESSVVEAKGCMTDRPGDLAWFVVTVEVHRDLEQISFSLIDPVGVRSVGPGEVIQPINQGGRIAMSGTVDWKDRHATWRASRQLQPFSEERATDWVPTAGQTALVSLRLRYSDAVRSGAETASLSGVRAVYELPDESTGGADVFFTETMGFGKDCTTD